MKKRRIKHNDLTAWFLEDHAALPASYLASCEEFFKSLKPQASSCKQRASSCKLDGWPDSRYSRIIKEKL